MNREISTIVILVIGFALASSATAKEIMPMFGGVLIDGYDLGKDTSLKGTLSYNSETNGFKGSYRGLKMPALAEVRDRIHQKLIRQQELSLPNTLLDSASKDILVKRNSSTNSAARNTAMSDGPTTIKQN
jgi:hypothetical protein